MMSCRLSTHTVRTNVTGCWSRLVHRPWICAQVSPRPGRSLCSAELRHGGLVPSHHDFVSAGRGFRHLSSQARSSVIPCAAVKDGLLRDDVIVIEVTDDYARPTGGERIPCSHQASRESTTRSIVHFRGDAKSLSLVVALLAEALENTDDSTFKARCGFKRPEAEDRLVVHGASAARIDELVALLNRFGYQVSVS